MFPSDAAALDSRWRRVAVTGATGFVGGHLIERLREAGVDVLCVCRPTSNRERLEARGFACRVVVPEEDDGWKQVASEVDVIFHLAAATSARTARDYYRANTELTRRIARAALACPSPPLFVYCSSIAAAGPVPRGQLRTPGTPVAPVSHYGRSKRGGELALAELAGAMPITIVRPGIVFGPGNRELYPLFASLARTRLHIVPGCRPPLLSLIHVEDLVELLWRAAERGARLPPLPLSESSRLAERDGVHVPANDQGVYFAGAPEQLDYRQLGNAVAQALGLRYFLTLHVPQPLPFVIAAAVEAWSRMSSQDAPFQIDKIREAVVPSWACHDPRLAEELQFSFVRSLQERLEETARWYREQQWL